MLETAGQRKSTLCLECNGNSFGTTLSSDGSLFHCLKPAPEKALSHTDKLYPSGRKLHCAWQSELLTKVFVTAADQGLSVLKLRIETSNFTQNIPWETPCRGHGQICYGLVVMMPLIVEANRLQCSVIVRASLRADSHIPTYNYIIVVKPAGDTHMCEWGQVHLPGWCLLANRANGKYYWWKRCIVFLLKSCS